MSLNFTLENNFEGIHSIHETVCALKGTQPLRLYGKKSNLVECTGVVKKVLDSVHEKVFA